VTKPLPMIWLRMFDDLRAGFPNRRRAIRRAALRYDGPWVAGKPTT